MLGDSLRRRHAPKKTERPEAPQRPAPARGPLPGGYSWWHWILVAVAVLLASFGIGYFAASQLLFPAPETAGVGVAVPDLYGQGRAEAESAIRQVGLEVGATTSLASRDIPAGRVLAQDPVPGQQLRPGAQVRLVVSAGPPAPIMPAVTGLGQRSARELLEAIGFAVEVQQAPSTLPAGTVTRTDPGPGVEVRLPATVSLIVSAGPPEPAPDTAGPQATPDPGVAWR